MSRRSVIVDRDDQRGSPTVVGSAAPFVRHFCFHGAHGAFLDDLGRNAEAREAFTRAIVLAGTPAEDRAVTNTSTAWAAALLKKLKPAAA